jgi:hypothetical protein
MKRILFVTLGVIVPAVAAVGAALAAGGLSGAKAATAELQTIAQAKRAGYTQKVRDLAGIACIEASDGSGAMGVHMLNPKLLDGKIDAARPEILVYEPLADGKAKLVALEYLVLAKDWKGKRKPALFGRPFDTVEPGNRYGLPKAYALHAWVWKANRAGTFAPYNAEVDCRPGR